MGNLWHLENYQQGYQVPIENLGMTIDTNTNIYPVQFTNYINILP